MKTAHLSVVAVACLCALASCNTTESDRMPPTPGVSKLVTSHSEEPGKMLAACLALAAKTYALPPEVLMGIYLVEAGKIGEEYGPLPDGSYEFGPMRINSSQLPDMAADWKMNEHEAATWIRDDPCTNTGLAGWILKRHWDKAGNLSDALAAYNEKSEAENAAFKKAVISAIADSGLLRAGDTAAKEGAATDASGAERPSSSRPTRP